MALPRLITALPGPKAAAIIDRDRAVISDSYTRSYPLVAERGEGALVEDVDGNVFLDFAAGIAVVATGHCHPQVVEAIRDQAGRLIHMSGTDFYYENMVRLAERLAGLAPGPRADAWGCIEGAEVGEGGGGGGRGKVGEGARKVFFRNSGAEAVEAAIKLARYHTGRGQFVAFVGAFHGRTMGALALTDSKAIQKKGFFPMMPGVHHVPYAYCYRCAYGKTPDSCAVECVQAIETELFRTALPPEECAAIFVEPVQGEGGYVAPPRKFFDELRRVADEYGILLVFDEVQSGMGRTGKMFAAEHFGAVPDVMVLAKGIASGLPLGATVAWADLMKWPPGAHANTFGGNPVAVAAALATLDLLERELMENAAQMGEYLMERLREWPRRFRHVGDVRGLGLMIGIELVKDQGSKERDPQLRNKLVQMCFERGLLVLGAGPNTIRLCPPLVISKDQADFAVGLMEECLVGVGE